LPGLTLGRANQAERPQNCTPAANYRHQYRNQQARKGRSGCFTLGSSRCQGYAPAKKRSKIEVPFCRLVPLFGSES